MSSQGLAIALDFVTIPMSEAVHEKLLIMMDGPTTTLMACLLIHMLDLDLYCVSCGGVHLPINRYRCEYNKIRQSDST